MVKVMSCCFAPSPPPEHISLLYTHTHTHTHRHTHTHTHRHTHSCRDTAAQSVLINSDMDNRTRPGGGGSPRFYASTDVLLHHHGSQLQPVRKSAIGQARRSRIVGEVLLIDRSVYLSPSLPPGFGWISGCLLAYSEHTLTDSV